MKSAPPELVKHVDGTMLAQMLKASQVSPPKRRLGGGDEEVRRDLGGDQVGTSKKLEPSPCVLIFFLNILKLKD